MGRYGDNSNPADADLTRAAVIARLRTALRTRSGRAWSVTGGSGTAYGWITIDVPPAARTWRQRESGARDAHGQPLYEWYDSGTPGGSMSPADCAELARWLGLDRPVHYQGVSIASSHAHYREYLDRAEGRPPRVIATPYWD